jgi:hypothetical protein
VLNKLYGVLADRPTDLPGVDRYDYRIRCIREWAGGLTNRCVQESYTKWLDHYARESRKVRQHLEKGAPPIDEWMKKIGEEQRRVAEYERVNQVPLPPDSCERSLIQSVR